MFSGWFHQLFGRRRPSGPWQAPRARPDVEPLEERWAFSVGVTECSIPTANATPTGLAVGSDGNLWFTESGTGKVGKVTPSGTFTEYALTSGRQPYGITAGPNGALWVTERDPGNL